MIVYDDQDREGQKGKDEDELMIITDIIVYR